jgi:hypothetical protein
VAPTIQSSLDKGRRQEYELLIKENGQITKNKDEMEGVTHDFFRQLYSTDQGVNPSELTQHFEPTISNDANAALYKEFTAEEIIDAMIQIGPLKAL